VNVIKGPDFVSHGISYIYFKSIFLKFLIGKKLLNFPLKETIDNLVSFKFEKFVCK
jgi:hypothetical protein